MQAVRGSFRKTDPIRGYPGHVPVLSIRRHPETNLDVQLRRFEFRIRFIAPEMRVLKFLLGSTLLDLQPLTHVQDSTGISSAFA